MSRFEYLAANEAGGRVSGAVDAADEKEAFDKLRQDGLRPIRLTAASASRRGGRVRLDNRSVGELSADLAALLTAGASMKTALGVLTDAAGDAPAGQAARALSEEISKGVAIDSAFSIVLGDRYPFVPALVAAGEASGDLPHALTMISETIERDIEIAEQIGTALSYPAFILAMTLGSVLMIVLLVVPALAPVIEETGGETSFVLGALIAVSGLLTEHAVVWLILLGMLVAGSLLAWRTGSLWRWLQALWLDGILSGPARSLVYGGFARSLGQLLMARAPAGEAIRLAIGALRLPVAAERLSTLATQVRGGTAISSALAQNSALPQSLAQMARIGEETGALGQMLERAGRLEQARALRRIRLVTRWLAPALIIVLGILIGILMTGLLSGVSALGESGIQ